MDVEEGAIEDVTLLLGPKEGELETDGRTVPKLDGFKETLGFVDIATDGPCEPVGEVDGGMENVGTIIRFMVGTKDSDGGTDADSRVSVGMLDG